MGKLRRTPQEKKRLSLALDRRNTYGENAKASRKAIPKRKRLAARAQRHLADASLKLALRAEVPEVATNSLLRSVVAKHRRWKKGADAPLGEVIAKKHQRRVQSRPEQAQQLAKCE